MQAGMGGAYLREQAAMCRRLADGLIDSETSATLRKMAVEYEAKANEIEGRPLLDGAAHPTVQQPPSASE